MLGGVKLNEEGLECELGRGYLDVCEGVKIGTSAVGNEWSELRRGLGGAALPRAVAAGLWEGKVGGRAARN